VDENEECLTILSSSVDLQRAATEINKARLTEPGSFDGQSIWTLYESAEGEKWLEIRRRL
jgi:hypothetical protein